VERACHKLEVERREAEVKRDNLEDRAMEEIGLHLATEYSCYREILDDGGVSPVNQAETIGEIDSLKSDIHKLGNVNLDAIDEEDQLEARNEGLIKQVADLDSAKVQLTDLIERLNIASESRFKETFESIQKHFADPDGMFRQLFGGGRAEVHGDDDLVDQLRCFHAHARCPEDASGVRRGAGPPIVSRRRSIAVDVGMKTSASG